VTDDLDAAADLIADHLEKAIVDDWSRWTLARWLGMFPPARITRDRHSLSPVRT
jgi:hypothetical protein